MAIKRLENIEITVPQLNTTTGELTGENVIYNNDNKYVASDILPNYYNDESAKSVRTKQNFVKNYLKCADDYLSALSNFLLNSDDESIVSKINEIIANLNNVSDVEIPDLNLSILALKRSMKQMILDAVNNLDTSVKNKCWFDVPTVPYYKEDIWLCSEDITINKKEYKKGVAYICNNTNLVEMFDDNDWQPMSIFNYEQLVNLPKINNKTLKGNINVVTPDQIKNFVYSKTYNNIDSDITNITYDNSLECLKVLSTDTVTIAVPEEHVYTVTFDVQLLQNTNTKLYIIDDKGNETEYSAVVGKNDIVVTSDKIKFRVNDTMWIKNITVTGLDIEIPKKVSQLENDLKYNHLDVSEPETIVVNIPNKL